MVDAKRFLITLLAAVLALSGMAEAARLKAPFEIAVERKSTDASAPDFVCKTPPPAVRDLTFGGFYRRGTGSSIVDKEAMRRYRTARRPVDRFERAVSKMSDQYIVGRLSDPSRARCVLDWLSHWAGAGGFLGEVSSQGGFVRKWSLGTMSLVYLKIRDESTLDPVKKAVVRDWIATWAKIIRRDYSTGLHRNSRNNNHVYWAGWSVGLAAVVTDNREQFDWMVGRYRAALRQIGADGTLMLELDRGSKALHYHVFSVQALIMIAELAIRNGIDLYDAEGGALHRLVTRTVDGLIDPGYFKQLTGHAQKWVGRLSGSKLTWMEPYFVRFPNGAMEPWLKKFRPLKNRRTGGNATLLYGLR